MGPKTRAVITGVSLAAFLAAAPGGRKPAEAKPRPAPHIHEHALRAHVSFLASDLLEGRGTPSRGLEIAAEYIAAQFRIAGLDPAVHGGYFQTAHLISRRHHREQWKLRLQSPEESITPAAGQLAGSFAGPQEVADAAVWKGALPEMTGEEPVRGKALATDSASFLRLQRARRHALLARLAPALVIVFYKTAQAPPAGAALMDQEGADPAPILRVYGPETAALFDAAPAGATALRASFRAPAPEDSPAVLRNVAARIPGSDPKLSDTCVLVTAHYDHLGMGTPDGGDNIYNGANDDASGTAAVIEIASALRRAGLPPKRTLLFVLYFGEETGLLGSRYYARSPICPLEKTVAQINLEHMGRTDDNEGPRRSTFALTGFDFSDVGARLERAAGAAGVTVTRNPASEEVFFPRSDNIVLARRGIPAHTVTVTYLFPDYHGPDDEADKLDYGNMARVTGALASGILSIANDPAPPKWNEANPSAAAFASGSGRSADR